MARKVIPDPYGCDSCGVKQSGHGWRYNKQSGQHQWIKPSDWKILVRMQARRSLREQSKGGK